MSWSGFKKSVNRAGTTLMQKTGQVDKTVDREFQEEVERFKILEKSSTSLQKNSKTYLDSIRAMTSAQARIAETIDHFYDGQGGTSEDTMVGHAYKRVVEELEKNSRDDFDTPYRHTVLEPIGRLCSYFPEVNNIIAKRSKKLLDYDSLRTKARKMAEKPPEDPSKLPRAEKEADDAKAVFETINNQLVVELPQLLDLRVPYLDPSFEAMVKMQLRFVDDGYTKLSSIQRYLPETVRDDYAEGRLDAQVEGALQEMRDLSICGLSG